MKMPMLALAMMALMLSAGPAMAMDSVYLEKRQKQLYENSDVSAEEMIEKSRTPDERGDAKKRSVRKLSSEREGEGHTSDPWWWWR